MGFGDMRLEDELERRVARARREAALTEPGQSTIPNTTDRLTLPARPDVPADGGMLDFLKAISLESGRSRISDK